MATEANISGPADDKKPDFFEKMHQIQAAILIYQSSLEHKNFVNLKDIQLFYLGMK